MKGIGTIAGASALMLLAVGCGSSGSGSGASVSSAPAATHSDAASPVVTGQSAQTAALHGIVLATPASDSTIELQAVNPSTGAVTATRSFTEPDTNQAVNNSNAGILERPSFNQNFTEMAVTGPSDANGGTAAGVVDAHGNYHALTTGSSGGYGVVYQHDALGFDPAGNFWFIASPAGGNGNAVYGYVDPSGKQHLTTNHDWTPNGMPDQLSSEVYFVPDGRGSYQPLPTLSAPEDVFLPGGPEVQRDPVNFAYQVGPDLTLAVNSADNYQVVPKSAGMPWMNLPVSSTSFLCHSGDNTQIYLGVLSGHTVHLHPLLPTSNWTVGDVVVNPSGTQVAFMSTDPAGNTHLFTVSLSGNQAAPHELTEFNGSLSTTPLQSTSLVAWNN
jgi:hypothetical protein